MRLTVVAVLVVACSMGGIAYAGSEGRTPTERVYINVNGLG